MDKNKEQTFRPGFYLVSTPIGNMQDITLRALTVLKKSDVIFCEDTRRSAKLLSYFNIKNKTVSYHKFNEKKISNKIIDWIKSNYIVSLISDAGTPNISDPGEILINECIKNNIKIFPIPGPSAVTSAVSISGFSDKFFFYGFFPEKKKNLLNDLKYLSTLNYTLVFFVSPKKINKIIPELKKNFSGRQIVFCREISKLYEEFIRCDIDDLKIFSNELKGEITIVISEEKNSKSNSQKLTESDKNSIKKMINKLSLKEITNIITVNRDVSKKEIYNYCISLKNEN